MRVCYTKNVKLKKIFALTKIFQGVVASFEFSLFGEDRNPKVFCFHVDNGKNFIGKVLRC